ncbi:MAG: HEAT repeat domain-containing protein [Sandaracinaceae bacterium]
MTSEQEAERRRRALTALEHAADDARAERLIEALGDVDWRVRKEAVRVASAVAEPWGLLDALVAALVQGDNVGLRNAALEVMERLGPRAADALLTALPSVPDTARKFLVAALGCAGPSALPALAEIAQDADANTAQAALEALARIGGPEAETALRGHLGSPDPVQRLAALEGLERLEATVTLDVLRPLLEDRLVRRPALRLLGYTEDPEAGEVLLASLEAPGGHPTGASGDAVAALGRMLSRGGPAAREIAEVAPALGPEVRAALRTLAGERRPPTRRAATWLLLLARDVEVLGLAAEAVAEDRLPPVALEALRVWGTDAVDPLLDIAPELSGGAHAAALVMAAELAQAGEATSAQVARLRGALRSALDAEPSVASSAVGALEAFAESSDVPRLVELANHTHGGLARAAAHALTSVAAREPTVVEDAVVEANSNVGAALVPVMATLGGGSASDQLQAALSADDVDTRRAAVIALTHLDPVPATELAGFAMADEDLGVQTAAVRVLAELARRDGAPRPQAVAHLRLALRAHAEPVVATAAAAIGDLGDRASVPHLRDLVSEGRPGIAVAAMAALRVLEDPALHELLVDALGQNDEELVKEALRSLAEQPGPRRSSRLALALDHPAWDVRTLAAELLGEVGGDDGQRALAARLPQETDPGVRAVIEAMLDAESGEAD